MAAGKNLASDILVSQGFVSLDADAEVHKVLESPEIVASIVKEFGALALECGLSLVAENGKLLRRNLGALIFKDPALVARQEAIVYPALTARVKAFAEENRARSIVLNAAVLYKIPELVKMVDSVLYVDAPVILRLVRARKRDSDTVGNILRRFRNQRTLFSKYKDSVADIQRVWNIGSRRLLERKILCFLRRRLPQTD